jgi:hypothetical protein
MGRSLAPLQAVGIGKLDWHSQILEHEHERRTANAMRLVRLSALHIGLTAK